MTQTIPFDITKLEPAVIEMPPPTARGREAAPNPFRDWLKASYDDGQGRSVTAPTPEAATEILSAIRRAATKLEIGSRVVFKDSKNRVVKYLSLPTGKKVKDEKGVEYDETKMQYVRENPNGGYIRHTGPLTVLYQGQKARARKPEAPSDAPVENGDAVPENTEAAPGSADTAGQ